MVSVDFINKNKDIFLYNKKRNKFIKSDIEKHLKKLVSLGAGEILLTDINRDGSEDGLNIEIAKNLSSKLDIPLIISRRVQFIKRFCELF